MQASEEPRGTAPTAIVENIQSIAQLEAAAQKELTRSERISNVITDFAGSLSFVALHLMVFGFWAVWNVVAPASQRFDPYPFGLLTMLVSLESVFLGTFVLITQNRIMAHSERRDHLALQVNMLAEQELTAALRMLRQLSDRLGVQPETEQQERVQELMEETNVYEVMTQLDRQLSKPAPSDTPADR